MIQGDIKMRKAINKFDFSSIGKAIKTVREDRGWTREQVGEMVDLAPRYLLALENEGKNPSGQVLVELATLFNISLDQYIYPNKKPDKTSIRLQLDSLLDTCDDDELTIVTATVGAIIQIRKAKEE